jgi:hypothetical protein
MALAPEVMEALLGAVARTGSKPNADEIEQTLKQLAIATAAIVRVLPPGTRQRYEMMFAMECEREVVRKEPE